MGEEGKNRAGTGGRLGGGKKKENGGPASAKAGKPDPAAGAANAQWRNSGETEFTGCSGVSTAGGIGGIAGRDCWEGLGENGGKESTHRVRTQSPPGVKSSCSVGENSRSKRRKEREGEKKKGKVKRGSAGTPSRSSPCARDRPVPPLSPSRFGGECRACSRCGANRGGNFAQLRCSQSRRTISDAEFPPVLDPPFENFGLFCPFGSAEMPAFGQILSELTSKIILLFFRVFLIFDFLTQYRLSYFSYFSYLSGVH